MYQPNPRIHNKLDKAYHSDDQEILKYLSTCKGVNIRRGVATNKHTNINILKEMLNDTCIQVLEGLAMRKNMPADFYQSLYDKNEHLIECVLCNNESTPVSILLSILNNCNQYPSYVRVLSLKTAHAQVIEKIIDQLGSKIPYFPISDVCFNLLKNENLTLTHIDLVLLKISNSKTGIINDTAEAFLNHPRTTKQMLLQFAKSRIYYKSIIYEKLGLKNFT